MAHCSLFLRLALPSEVDWLTKSIRLTVSHRHANREHPGASSCHRCMPKYPNPLLAICFVSKAASPLYPPPLTLLWFSALFSFSRIPFPIFLSPLDTLFVLPQLRAIFLLLHFHCIFLSLVFFSVYFILHMEICVSAIDIAFLPPRTASRAFGMVQNERKAPEESLVPDRPLVTVGAIPY